MVQVVGARRAPTELIEGFRERLLFGLGGGRGVRFAAVIVGPNLGAKVIPELLMRLKIGPPFGVMPFFMNPAQRQVLGLTRALGGPIGQQNLDCLAQGLQGYSAGGFAGWGGRV